MRPGETSLQDARAQPEQHQPLASLLVGQPQVLTLWRRPAHPLTKAMTGVIVTPGGPAGCTNAHRATRSDGRGREASFVALPPPSFLSTHASFRLFFTYFSTCLVSGAAAPPNCSRAPQGHRQIPTGAPRQLQSWTKTSQTCSCRARGGRWGAASAGAACHGHVIAAHSGPPALSLHHPAADDPSHALAVGQHGLHQPRGPDQARPGPQPQ